MAEPFSIPLNLALSEHAQRDATAWLLPFADAQTCLSELTTWQVDLMATRLFLLPHSRTNLQTSALFAIPPAGSKPKTFRALPYGLEGSKTYLPIHATLRPAINIQELNAAIQTSLAVWHPGLGLIEFDEPKGLRIWHLLEAPVLQAENWNAAQVSLEIPPQLRAIGLRMESIVENPFGDAGNDIAQENPKALPPTKGEASRNPLVQMGRNMVGKLLAGRAIAAAGFSKIGQSQFGGSGGKQTSANQPPPLPGAIRKWLTQQSAAFFEKMQKARNAEIHRLMDMLQKDPEKALKFALPLTGDFARGMAPPNSRLGERSTNFQLGQLGGGQSTDVWNLGMRERLQLANLYRAQANRCLAEGRFRRAAYIFAQLLGELDSAAEALKRGKFFAEAAVIYRDRLNNKRKAAACLAEGGLLLEAARLQEEVGEWVAAGDLYSRQENSSEAKRCYIHAVEQALQKRDTLSAAVITEHKVGNPQTALKLLRDAWPDGSQALPCLTAEFDFYVRHEQAHAARQRIAELRQTSPPAPLAGSFCKLLTGLARAYPDSETRNGARVLAYHVGSQALMQQRNSQQILDALAALHPEDKVFKRDAQRFLTPPNIKTGVKTSEITTKQKGTISAKGGQLIAGELHKVHGITRVLAATYGPGGLAIVGTTGNSNASTSFIQAWCIQPETSQSVYSGRWEIPTSLLREQSRMQIGWFQNHELWLRHPAGPVLKTSTFGRTSTSGPHPLRGGTLETLPADTIAIDTDEGTEVKALQSNGTVSCYRKDGTLVWTHVVPLSDPIFHDHSGFACRRNKSIIALYETLQIFSDGNMEKEVLFDQLITSFAANSPYAKPLIAAGLQKGVALLSVDDLQSFLINDSIESPQVIFTAKGTLLAFSDNGALAIQMRGDEPAEVHPFPWTKRPAAITAGPERNQAILVYEEGSWQIVEFQEPQYGFVLK